MGIHADKQALCGRGGVIRIGTGKKAEEQAILKRSLLILKAMRSFGSFKLGDGSIRQALQKATLTAQWEILTKGRIEVHDTIYETSKVTRQRQ